jgi:hypothetical protein
MGGELGPSIRRDIRVGVPGVSRAVRAFRMGHSPCN